MGPLLRRAIVFASCLALLPAGAYAKSKAKDDAQVQCKDGTMSKPGRGACSHHGGVAAPTAGDDRPEKAAASNARSAVDLGNSQPVEHAARVAEVRMLGDEVQGRHVIVREAAQRRLFAPRRSRCERSS